MLRQTHTEYTEQYDKIVSDLFTLCNVLRFSFFFFTFGLYRQQVSNGYYVSQALEFMNTFFALSDA